jgi:hypothetical protein
MDQVHGVTERGVPATDTVRVSEPQRRDRMLLLSAFAITFLTLLGEAGEDFGMDRLLKSNTARKRIHSLFCQRCMLYELMPGMSEQRLAPLVERFLELIQPAANVPERLLKALIRGDA